MSPNAELMLQAYVEKLVSQLQAAQQKAVDGGEYEIGLKLGLYEALSVLYNRAQSFDISLASIGLGDVNPDAFI